MFMLSDQPDAQRDEEVAETMIANRQQAIKAERDQGAKSVEPAVERDVLRAWVAYAKQETKPTIERDEVKQRIKELYVSLRTANKGDGPVPVTARKLEAFMRLAESSARVRLDNEVRISDAERASRLVLRSMRDVGVDPDTGQFDADIVETGQSNSQKERKHDVLALISDLQDEGEAGAPHSMVVSQADEMGHEADRTEHTIEKLLNKGTIYQPKNNEYRRS
jgi:replicative DNA helicase Mcm